LGLIFKFQILDGRGSPVKIEHMFYSWPRN